ncbi:family 78 glycoside hydrolase catalytic domain [Nonomuraea sp. NPDC050783]|uniref:family 78 glycoside hydrolase catalytic domain n=1 Tax=Nonomuraea sp. NPDC050783 TaxID=3154634 RepID=UPI0034653244
MAGPNKDQTDVLICADDQPLTYEPAFTFHGFRYARLTASAPFRLADVQAVVIASDPPETSQLRTSDPPIDRLHQNVVWSQRGNFLSVPTDCPQRERAGWTGDFQIFAPAASNNVDVRNFAERWPANVRAEQHDEGAAPTVVPVIPSMESPTSLRAAAGWSDAIALVPWALWERYADRRVLQDNDEAMCRWVACQWRQATSSVPDRLGDDLDEARRARHLTMWNTGPQFGDWLAPSGVAQGLDPITMVLPTLHSEMVAAMFHVRSTWTVAQVARVLGRESDAERPAARAAVIREAFARRDGQVALTVEVPAGVTALIEVGSLARTVGTGRHELLAGLQGAG